MQQSFSLSEWDTSSEAVVVEVKAPELLRQRLFSMGFVPGTSLSLLAKTAFGGPRVFRLRGGKVAIRKEDAACIFVRSLGE